MHYSVAKLKQIEAIEFAVIDTADPKTPQTALARFIKNVSNIKSASARADLYKQVIDAPGLDDTEKAWVKIIQIFDTQGNGPEERTKLMEDISNVAISTSPETVTAADVLEHAADSPEGWKFFRALGKIFTHDNAQKVAPLAAIVFPQAAPVLVAYGLRNVPVNVYGAFTVDCEQKRADHVRAVIGGLGDGLKNSGPLVKPLAWIGMKLGWIGSAIELFMKDGVKSLASNLSDKKKSEEMMAFLESINNDPKSAVQIFDNLGTYFGSKSDVIAGFAVTAV
ncbi:MAG TPA: hypothetical protein PLO23_10820, partial [Alphaproteobacteria bacterium]|nr:hypothetical protein [Alphaproteobacteria bacterium]